MSGSKEKSCFADSVEFQILKQHIRDFSEKQEELRLETIKKGKTVQSLAQAAEFDLEYNLKVGSLARSYLKQIENLLCAS